MPIISKVTEQGREIIGNHRVVIARAAVSLVLAMAPAVLTMLLLGVAIFVWGADVVEATVETLINTHLPWLTPLSNWIKARDWALWIIVWAAWSLTVFRNWSEKVAFFALAPQDLSVMEPATGSKIDLGLIPWVESPRQPGQSTEAGSKLQGLRRQGASREALITWMNTGAGDGYWGRFWPRQPTSANTAGWRPLSLALLTGANGVGKSALVFNLAARLGRPLPALDGKTERRNARAALLRTVLPWRRRLAGDPWDVGFIPAADHTRIEALRKWAPRRPTLLLLDEPGLLAAEMLKVLATHQERFWHPVRVILIDQAFPWALSDFTLVNSEVPVQRSAELEFGELLFDDTDIRMLWSELCRVADKGESVACKLWGEAELKLVAHIAEGNPLQISLMLQHLAKTTVSVQQWYRDQAAEQGMTDALLEADTVDAGIRHRLVAERALDLKDTYLKTVRRHGETDSHDIMRAIAAATIAGGLHLGPELRRRVTKAMLDELFPGRRDTGGRTWVPPVRPTLIARSYLHQWLDSFVAPPNEVAEDVARMAWELCPEGALRALEHGPHLTPALRAALIDVADQAASPLLFAQACCIGVLSDRADASALRRALDRLPSHQMRPLEVWFLERLDPTQPRLPEALGVLIALMHVAAARAKKLGLEKDDQFVERFLAEFRRWAPIARNVLHAGRRASFAEACTCFIKALVQHPFEMSLELLKAWALQMIGHGSKAPIEACRVLLREARTDAKWKALTTLSALEADALAATWVVASQLASCAGGRGVQLATAIAMRVERVAAAREEFAGQPGVQEQRATAWRHAAYAACQLDGQGALAQTKELAERVQRIATGREEFAGHPGLQEQCAAAWRHAAFAACQLGGQGALAQTKELAERVERIATAREEFAGHPGLQEQSAKAWTSAAYAAAQLGGQGALAQTKELAERVQRIATAREEFAGHPGLQEECATAWRYAAFAACHLGGQVALAQSKELAERVQRIATARGEFAGHPGLQVQCATALRHAAFAASQLGGQGALAQTMELAECVERIATAREEFAGHPGLKLERVRAWNLVAVVLARLSGQPVPGAAQLTALAKLRNPSEQLVLALDVDSYVYLIRRATG